MRPGVVLIASAGLIFSALALGILAFGLGGGVGTGVVAAVEDVEAGKRLYQQRCLGCHGPEGKGDGAAASFVVPRPRDFTGGQYKIRTTASGELPRDEDIFKVITEGMPGTSMPGWTILSESERWQLVAYIKTFSEAFAGGVPPEEVTLEEGVASSAESISQGRELYTKLKCWECHGQAGRGDGPSAATLTDDWGFPIKATNLTRGWNFRGGSSARDIYRTFTTGLNGTPMPSYVDSTTEEERWHLASFVRSLSPRARPSVKAVLTAKAIDGGLPSSPDDPRWNEAEAFSYPLVGQVIAEPRWFTPSIDSVTVKALHNGEDIAFLLMWDDPTDSAPEAGAGVFSDALALQFPAQVPTSLEKPYFIMGDARHSVNLWRWQAHPAAVEELNGTGPGKLELQPVPRQNAVGQARYDQGQWQLVLKRPLVTADKDGDIQFETGRFIPVAFLAWDGSAGEQEAQGSLSSWYFLLLEKPTALGAYAYVPISMLLVVGFELWLVRTVRRREAKAP